ncbi:molecular chaperone DnaJ [Sphingobium sp. C100]|uniref:J domain-containing protein n=1 Tax=Sphingobium sp. C100 TaxID=1207055 RepID=UPI0003D67406|nr:J domain-containing protein [Sphingobium sp. C100]ETI60437.1 molecular chaperone DnaJ [Sphingobium sp. C100]PHQ63783.1 MAG: molecular chaperone DnaJ [Sphingobium sp.]
MARNHRSNDWGFPRWRSYGAAREAQQVRLCDRYGCDRPGDCPAPKSPNSRERWHFCADHAAEYNRNWDYFQGLDQEEREQRERAERRDASGYQSSAYHGWGGPGDGSRSRDEIHALKALDLEDDASFEAVKKSWRRLAKENHPDVKPGDADAAVRFQTIQAAYEVLRAAEERRSWKPRDAAD